MSTENKRFLSGKELKLSPVVTFERLRGEYRVPVIGRQRLPDGSTILIPEASSGTDLTSGIHIINPDMRRFTPTRVDPLLPPVYIEGDSIPESLDEEVIEAEGKSERKAASGQTANLIQAAVAAGAMILAGGSFLLNSSSAEALEPTPTPLGVPAPTHTPGAPSLPTSAPTNTPLVPTIAPSTPTLPPTQTPGGIEVPTIPPVRTATTAPTLAPATSTAKPSSTSTLHPTAIKTTEATATLAPTFFASATPLSPTEIAVPSASATTTRTALPTATPFSSASATAVISTPAPVVTAQPAQDLEQPKPAVTPRPTQKPEIPRSLVLTPIVTNPIPLPEAPKVLRQIIESRQLPEIKIVSNVPGTIYTLEGTAYPSLGADGRFEAKLTPDLIAPKYVSLLRTGSRIFGTFVPSIPTVAVREGLFEIDQNGVVNLSAGEEANIGVATVKSILLDEDNNPLSFAKVYFDGSEEPVETGPDGSFMVSGNNLRSMKDPSSAGLGIIRQDGKINEIVLDNLKAGVNDLSKGISIASKQKDESKETQASLPAEELNHLISYLSDNKDLSSNEIDLVYKEFVDLNYENKNSSFESKIFAALINVLSARSKK